MYWQIIHARQRPQHPDDDNTPFTLHKHLNSFVASRFSLFRLAT